MKATSPFWLASRKIVQSYRTRAEACWSATGNSERSTKKIGQARSQNQKSFAPADFHDRYAPHRAATGIGAGLAMADNLSIDRRTSALLVMDFQTLIVDNYAADAKALLNRTAKLIAA